MGRGGGGEESRKSRTMNVLITQLKLQCVLIGEGEELIIAAAIVIMYHRWKKKKRKQKNEVYPKMKDPDAEHEVLSASMNITFRF